MGGLNYFLGLQVSQRKDGIFICQCKYIRELLKKYNMEDSTPAKTQFKQPLSLIGIKLVRKLRSQATEV